jgi:YD repeat-containing protein
MMLITSHAIRTGGYAQIQQRRYLPALPAAVGLPLSKTTRHMKKLLTVLTAATMLFGACKKKDQPDPNPNPTPSTSGKRLTKVNYWTTSTNAEVTIREIEVNSSGDITAIKTFGTDGSALLTLNTFTKDANGRINLVEGTFKTGDLRKWELKYDANGNVTECTHTNQGVATTTKYTYDNDNRLTMEEEFKSGTTNLGYRITYTYTGTSKNPATRKSESLYISPATVTESSFTFDGKKNPHLSLGSNLLYFIGMGEIFTENVSVEVVKGGSTYNNTHQYNSDDYATSRDGGKGNGLKFYYQ